MSLFTINMSFIEVPLEIFNTTFSDTIMDGAHRLDKLFLDLGRALNVKVGKEVICNGE